jgi:hypothetical protein
VVDTVPQGSLTSGCCRLGVLAWPRPGRLGAGRSRCQPAWHRLRRGATRTAQGLGVDLVGVEPAQFLGEQIGGVPPVQGHVPLGLVGPAAAVASGHRAGISDDLSPPVVLKVTLGDPRARRRSHRAGTAPRAASVEPRGDQVGGGVVRAPSASTDAAGDLAAVRLVQSWPPAASATAWPWSSSGRCHRAGRPTASAEPGSRLGVRTGRGGVVTRRCARAPSESPRTGRTAPRPGHQITTGDVRQRAAARLPSPRAGRAARTSGASMVSPGPVSPTRISASSRDSALGPTGDDGRAPGYGCSRPAWLAARTASY